MNHNTSHTPPLPCPGSPTRPRNEDIQVAYDKPFRVRLAAILGLEPYELKMIRIIYRLNYYFQIEGSLAQAQDPMFDRLIEILLEDLPGRIWAKPSRNKYQIWKWHKEVQGYEINDVEALAYCLRLNPGRHFAKLLAVHRIVWEYLEPGSYTDKHQQRRPLG